MQAYMGGSLITNSNIQKNYPALELNGQATTPAWWIKHHAMRILGSLK